MENVTLEQYKDKLKQLIEDIGIMRRLAYLSAQKDTGQEFPEYTVVMDPEIERKIEFLRLKIKELEDLENE